MAQATYNAVWLELEDGKSYTVTADTASAFTFGSAVDIPNVVALGMDPMILEHIIKGDNKIGDAVVRQEGMRITLTTSLLPLSLLATWTGGTASQDATGGTSNSKVLVEDDDEHAYVKLAFKIARAKEFDGTAGATNAVATFYKCKLTGWGVNVQGEPGTYQFNFICIGSRNNKDIYDLVNYEAAQTLA